MAEAEHHEMLLGEGDSARRIAVRLRRGKSPTIVWLGGFRSDMGGTKATRLDAWAETDGHACLLFDYSGHGRSTGDFEAGTIGTWLRDAAEVVAEYAGESPLLVGSSMGGWIAALLALRMRVAGHPPHGMVLIAPALDFTERLMWDQFSDEIRTEIMETGRWMRPSEYDGPYPITRTLIEEGRNHLLLDRDLIEFGCPVHILQGRHDEDVPLEHCLELVSRLGADDVTLSVVHDGDHRLSREQDIELLLGDGRHDDPRRPHADAGLVRGGRNRRGPAPGPASLPSTGRVGRLVRLSFPRRPRAAPQPLAVGRVFQLHAQLVLDPGVRDALRGAVEAARHRRELGRLEVDLGRRLDAEQPGGIGDDVLRRRRLVVGEVVDPPRRGPRHGGRDGGSRCPRRGCG